MASSRQIAFSKRMSALKKAGHFSKCYHPDHSTCSERIQKCHSVQEQGKLSLLADSYHSQRKILTFEDFQESDDFPGFLMPKPKGVANTNVFPGFCNHHDTTIFSPIENFAFDPESLEQCFLYAYRSQVYSFWDNERYLRGISSPEYQRSTSDKVSELTIWMKDVQKALSAVTRTLDCALLTEQWDSLYHTIYKFPRTPIACTSVIFPRFFPGDNTILSRATYLILSVFPETISTYVVLSCLASNIETKSYIDRLTSLPLLQRQKAISSFCIADSGSLIISPRLWDRLRRGKKKFLKDIKKYKYKTLGSPQTSFKTVRTNLFASNLLD